MLDTATMKCAILVSILPYAVLLVVVGQDAEAQNPTSSVRLPAFQASPIRQRARAPCSPRLQRCL
jgi:hypothetical protein